ncbi:MAG TPA: hypothetical protein VFE13_20170 [Caulobacteraceae bacterium]|jgi:hypothetical protein|nr:hypothetical protein [Caulobacteraceae bacterium]
MPEPPSPFSDEEDDDQPLDEDDQFDEDDLLDEALEETFPASDPISPAIPGSD